jgi:hypothetical protein
MLLYTSVRPSSGLSAHGTQHPHHARRARRAVQAAQAAQAAKAGAGAGAGAAAASPELLRIAHLPQRHPCNAIGSHGALLYTQPCRRFPHRCSSKLPSLTARVSILRTTRRPKMLTRLHSPWPLGCSSQPSWIAIVQRRYYTVLPMPLRTPNLLVRVVRRGMATAAMR